jgi:hypothetical protein
MFRHPFLKLPLIALALILAFCVFARAHAGDSPVTAGTGKATAGNQQQEPVRTEGSAGTLQEQSPITVFRPATFVCAKPVVPLDPASGKALLSAPPHDLPAEASAKAEGAIPKDSVGNNFLDSAYPPQPPRKTA